MRPTEVLIFLLLGAVKSVSAWNKCERITIPTCQALGYNFTVMPNFLGHESQVDAEKMMEVFMPLVKYNCSPHLQFFVCSIFAPFCSEYVIGAIPSCRRVCEEVQSDCQPVLDEINFPWPTIFNCSRFPIPEKNGLCMQSPSRSEDSRRPGKDTNAWRSSTTKLQSTSCPNNFVRSKDPTSPLCTPLCESDAYYSKEEKILTRRWLTCWAWFCFSSTLFTLITFWLEPSRFRYPERPIIFVTLCYNFLSASYMMVTFFGSSSLICNPTMENETSYIVTNGLESPSCIVIFLITYYLDLCANIWWVILTITWFLSAAKKWSSEALQIHLASYFHTVAWAAPAILSVLALVLHKVSGNELTNLCQVSESASLTFLVMPHFILQTIGCIIGMSSAHALIKVCREMRGLGHSTFKLEKLIKRLAVLGVLYLLPAVGSLGCLIFEAIHQPRDQSFQALVNARCYDRSNSHSSVCQPNLAMQTNGVTVTLLRIFLSLFLGIASGMWVWTGKTFRTWKKLLSTSKIQMGPIAL